MKKKQEISSVDFSQEAISKAVKREMIESPGVLYPVAGGVLGLLAGAVLIPTWWMFGLGIGGLALGSGFFAANYGFRKETYANRYVQRLFDKMETERQQRTGRLKEMLIELGSEEGVSQFERITKKFETLKQMLGDKLNVGELTHSRYLGIAEQVYLGVIDNLYDLGNTVKGIKTIEEKHVAKRLKELEKLSAPNADESGEIETLQERLQLKDNQEVRVSQFLSQNEKAMTQLDMTIAAIADMRTEDERAELDLESAMNRLQGLAKRASNYSHK